MSARRDPRSFLAAALVRYGYAHDVAEALVQQALDVHAHELAERIRAERRRLITEGMTLALANGRDVDLIDPEVEK
ncbi:hypothetical protein ACFCZT_24650 [Streptomyces sp. NPDC056230]|uniref:hypothetical protein n=1 Tax=Streptomyces sp. NPDC056230 TaxID=3345754 RepID=UPI0035DEA622